jgi:hypothetical protein
VLPEIIEKNFFLLKVCRSQVWLSL